jgi:hypothetical protein
MTFTCWPAQTKENCRRIETETAGSEAALKPACSICFAEHHPQQTIANHAKLLAAHDLQTGMRMLNAHDLHPGLRALP